MKGGSHFNPGQDTSHGGYLTSITPNMDFRGLDTGTPASGSGGVTVYSASGTADITVFIRLPGIAIVAD